MTGLSKFLLYTVFLAALSSALLSCGGGARKYGGDQLGGSNSDNSCASKSNSECEKHSYNNCIWNVDRCDEKFKSGAPIVPDNLGKVKMLAVADRSFCAIDFNDELWCVPKYPSLGLHILPHASKKYLHVAIASPSGEDVVCATKLDGTSICFDKKGKEISGPTTKDKVLQTIPAPFHNTVCAFSATNLYCESDARAFEKLDDYSKLPGVKNLAKVNVTDNPLITGLAFMGSSYSDDEQGVFVSFSTRKLIWAVRDDAKRELWDFRKGNDGRPVVFSDIASFTTYEKIRCISSDNFNGPICGGGGTYHNDTDIPNDIKTAAISKIATTRDFSCVIVKNSGELKCWGNRKKTKNIPTDLKGVKTVAVGSSMACIIDKDDKLACFGEE